MLADECWKQCLYNGVGAILMNDSRDSIALSMCAVCSPAHMLDVVFIYCCVCRIVLFPFSVRLFLRTAYHFIYVYMPLLSHS